MQLLIYDDELLFSEALSSLLTSRGHQVAAGDFRQPSEDDQWDVCLANIRPPASEAAQLIQKIKLNAPYVPVVALSGEADLDVVSAALAAGADGVCLKIDGIDEIESVLTRAASRQRSGSEPVWSRSATSLVRRTPPRPRGAALTAKERAVLELLTEGASTAKIAAELGIGEATARTHLQHLFNKFGVHSRLALVASAVRTEAVRVPQQPLGGAR